MNEMKWPKKVWLTEEDAEDREWHLDGPVALEERPYIRADLVDGLVDLLKQDLEWMENGDEVGYGGYLYNKVKAALKALEEE